MIKKLRIKIILIIMTIVSIIAIGLQVGISVYTVKTSEKNLSLTIERMLDSKPMQLGNENFNNNSTIPICLVDYNMLNETATILSKDTYIDQTTLSECVEQIVSSNLKQGTLKTYNLFFTTKNSPSGLLIAFADSNVIKNATTNVWLTSSIIVTFVLIVMGIISVILSKIIVKPVEESINSQKQFIADASHELKTPLSVILANNKILQSNENNSKETTEWLLTNDEEIKHMSSIISDMLSLAQTESINKITKLPVNISKLVDKICLNFDTVAFDKKIKLCSDIDKEIEYNCDEKLMTQLVMILVDNAIKYEPPQGKVEVMLKKEGNSFKFSVKNHGTFISPQDLPHIFDRFYRSDKSRSSTGVGLGLAIAKSIAELHNANLKVVSNQDDGTIFTFNA